MCIGDHTDNLILKMKGPIRLGTLGDTKSGAQFDDRVGGVLDINCAYSEEPLIIRRIIAQHEHLLFSALGGSELDVVELEEVIGFRPVDSRAESKWDFLPSDCR